LVQYEERTVKGDSGFSKVFADLDTGTLTPDICYLMFANPNALGDAYEFGKRLRGNFFRHARGGP